MLSDLEDNTFKISVPIITNEELEKFNNYLETNLDNIVHEISNHVSRDREIILLKKVIEKQQKELEELKELNNETVTQIYIRVSKDFKDKIMAKIKVYKEKCKNCNFKGKICKDLIKNYNCTIGVCLKEFYTLLRKE